MRDNYLIGLADLCNGALLGYGNYENVEKYKKMVTDYVKELEKNKLELIDYLQERIQQFDSLLSSEEDEDFRGSVLDRRIAYKEILEKISKGDTNK